MIDVVLTALEIAVAETVARQRNADGIRAGARQAKYGTPDYPSFDLHRRGCLGELAAAKGLNCYWFGAGRDYAHDCDLGAEQIRTTTHPNGCLIIRPDETRKDEIQTPWILVVQHDDAHYVLAGWIVGRDGVRREYLRSPRSRPAAYFVPQAHLHSFPITDPLYRAADFRRRFTDDLSSR